MLRSLIFAAAAIGLFCTAPSAHAMDPASGFERVSFADLNLNREAGAKALLGRIRAAARRVCDEDYGRTPLRRRMLVRACVRESIERAVASLDHPTLTAVHTGRPLRQIAQN